MGMAPTIYRYDDVGAPVITDGRDRLYQILKACLIDGSNHLSPSTPVCSALVIVNTPEPDQSSYTTDQPAAALLP